MNETIGQIIHQARTSKKLSIGQVTRAIHIRESYLDAIERDSLSELPSSVQAKGFIRLYWSYLGLDETRLNEIWNPPVANLTPMDYIEPVPVPVKPTRKRPFVMEKSTRVLPADSQPEEQPVPEEKTPSRADYSFIQLGKSLQAQRERLSLTIENIETYTHIPAHYLRSIEAGKIDELPSPVQGKGMIANYAGFLDLDTDVILLQYADGLQARREEALQQVEQTQIKRKPFQIARLSIWRTLLSPDLILVGLLILAALIALIWGGSSILTYRAEAIRTTTAIPISDILIHTETATLTSLTETITPEMTEELTQAPIVIQVTGSATLEAITGTPGAPSIYPVQILVSALQRSYLQVIVDGKTAFNGRLMPGNPYVFNGQKQIEVISGNAAAIQIVHNQNNLGSPGVVGEVVHLVFGPDVYGTPTYTPTATFTNTPVPSRTPRPSNTYPPTRTPRDTSTPVPTSTPKPTNTPKPTVAP
jgi:cytoskeletal protein RodZ